MKKIIILFGFTCLTWTGYAQEEKVKVETSTETMDTVEFSKLLQTYNRIIRAREEKLRLFKIDLVGPYLFLVSNWDEKDAAKNRLINIAYEQKIKPNWSWIVESYLRLDRDDFQEVQGLGGIRYYYNMKRRMLKGKSANNFSGNYLSVTSTYSHQFTENDNHVTLNLLYGIQRRLGKRFFFDVNFGFENIFEAFEDREVGTDFILTGKWGIAF